MIRLAPALLALAYVSTSAGAEFASAPPWKRLTCEAPATPGDIRDIKCNVNGAGMPVRYRFTITFLGGHDDTTASLKASEDGSPLVCGKDSKTSLLGEDGEVSLFCNLSLKHDPGTSHVIAFSVVWSHAQYKDFELTAERDP